MQEYTIRSSHASTIAIDQHARSVAMCALDISTGETRSTKLAGCPTAGDMVEWAAAWATPPMRFVYESGLCGFQLARDIRALGHDCDMIAVSSIARSVDDKRLKDDRRDEASLLGAVTAPGSKSFWLSALYRAGGCAFSCCLLHALANTLIGGAFAFKHFTCDSRGARPHGALVGRFPPQAPNRRGLRRKTGMACSMN